MLIQAGSFVIVVANQSFIKLTFLIDGYSYFIYIHCIVNNVSPLMWIHYIAHYVTTFIKENKLQMWNVSQFNVRVELFILRIYSLVSASSEAVFSFMQLFVFNLVRVHTWFVGFFLKENCLHYTICKLSTLLVELVSFLQCLLT